ncbi:PDZ domain-containing protein [Candidatus Magnetominusculus xianensis]|uniref:Magnetosome protein mamP n=1 Tax=Candidatus Magnetominusculus xianensis TaxID=1748249 RepID=A0ABR5SJL3_9BACT|nr:PDZ domain-containing protein [Candidatus Magnetominusculus xianensis]KWT94830.1 magnetosome protein mamP [Candidatus Magnetominusculus xianensis]MBF0404722.1 PDZ domain-containing protein [Nitrospirota bacterium]
MNHLWRYLNYLIIGLIICTAAYLLIFNPAKFLNLDGRRDGIIKNVRQNAQTPEIVAWQQANPAGQAQDPNALNGADPYGQFYDPGAPQAQPGTQGVYAPQLDTNPVNQAPAAAVPPATTSPAVSPIEMVLQEGHWIGLETIPLTPAIAAANGVPASVSGVLIDEVTLVAANSGILAGDVITAINDVPVTDLSTFRAATMPVANAKRATVTVYRAGALNKFTVEAVDVLGIAQMEAAPMILPSDTAPHGYYGPCTKCHAISKTVKNTGQLAKDAGDVLTVVPPPIKWGAAPPHRDRGQCTNCHKII